MKLGVLMPVYNECGLLHQAVSRVAHAPLPPAVSERSIYLVDDGSTDGTTQIVREVASTPGVVPLFHPTNMGKGAALSTAWRAALDQGCDLLIIHDADLEYDPADHAPMLAPIIDGRADAVIGTRFLGQTHRVLYYWHSLANRFITTLSNMATNLNLTDIECCLKAFSREAARRISIDEKRFGVEPELIAKLARMRLPTGTNPDAPGRRARVYEVPVSYAGRTYAEGKKIRWTDGLSALGCILKHNLP